MEQAATPADCAAATDAHSPPPNDTGAAAEQHVSAAPMNGVGRDAHTLADAALLNRVGRVLGDMAAAREVSDAEIRQHAQDCARLMEQAYVRFEETADPADRERAYLWEHRRFEAHQALSPAWKAAREAQIQQDIAASAGYFVEQGDAARARIQGTKQ
jgi:hypothetical protein